MHVGSLTFSCMGGFTTPVSLKLVFSRAKEQNANRNTVVARLPEDEAVLMQATGRPQRIGGLQG